jgi:hypothetical protein
VSHYLSPYLFSIVLLFMLIPFIKNTFLKIIIIPIVIAICAFVISTEGPRSGPKRRNLLKTDFPSGLSTSFRVSTPLRCALQWGRLTVEMTHTSALIMYNWYHKVHCNAGQDSKGVFSLLN